MSGKVLTDHRADSQVAAFVYARSVLTSHTFAADHTVLACDGDQGKIIAAVLNPIRENIPEMNGEPRFPKPWQPSLAGQKLLREPSAALLLSGNQALGKVDGAVPTSDYLDNLFLFL